MTIKNEQGRSMVEMLGVLAVMGVLSVAGIAGYTTAMNKYRANELLNEASKRAAIVAMQIASGKSGEALSIIEFTQPSGYKFGVDTSYAVGGKTFSLTLSKDPNGNIDDAICTQMKATTGDNYIMTLGEKCATITFNADMSRGVDTSGSGSTTGGEEEACDLNASECLSGALVEGECACAPVTGDNVECTGWTNNKCGKGKYCQFTPDDPETNPASGVCKDINTCGEKGTYGNFWMSDYGSDCSPDWWTAQSICAAKGKHMVNLTEVGCEAEYGACSSSTLSAIRGAGLTYDFWTTDVADPNAWGIGNNAYVSYDPNFYRIFPNNVLCVN